MTKKKLPDFDWPFYDVIIPDYNDPYKKQAESRAHKGKNACIYYELEKKSGKNIHKHKEIDYLICMDELPQPKKNDAKEMERIYEILGSKKELAAKVLKARSKSSWSTDLIFDLDNKTLIGLGARNLGCSSRTIGSNINTKPFDKVVCGYNTYAKTEKFKPQYHIHFANESNPNFKWVDMYPTETEEEKTMKLKFVYANGKPYHVSNVMPGSFSLDQFNANMFSDVLVFDRCRYTVTDTSKSVDAQTNYNVDVSDCIAVEIHGEHSVKVFSNPAYDVNIDVKTTTKRSRIREHNLELKKTSPKSSKKKAKAKKENPEKYMTEAEKIEHREYHKAKKLVREMEAKKAQQKPKKKPAVGSKAKTKSKTEPKPKFGSKSKQKARAKSTYPTKMD